MLGQNTCGTMIKHIHDDLEKSANNAMRKNKITMTQCTALLIIDNRIDKQMTLKDLEYELRVAQSTAASSPSDKRIKMLRITSSGSDCCKTAYQEMQKAEDMLLSGLTKTEQEIFLSLLKKVSDTI